MFRIIIAGVIASLAYYAQSRQSFDLQQYSSPPVFPSPPTQGNGGWEDAYNRAKSFVSQLTVEEKSALVTGTLGPCVGNIGPIERLGFHGLCLQDGPLAIRQALYASVFPAGVTTAASWDKSLMNLRGVYMGQEFRDKGANVALGPVAGPLGRTPYAGRNWEGFSPDPYLTGIAMEQTISGVQSTGVQACAKHFIAYEQETQRNPSGSPSGKTIESVSSNLDDRTMHELYLWPFYNSVRAGVQSVMCSYNRINSTYACENSKVLNGLLKEELGFQGYVVSDWEGTHSGVASALAGLDMNMPGGLTYTSSTPTFWGANLTTAVNNGSVPESRLTDMGTRVMLAYFQSQQNTSYPTVDPSESMLNTFSSNPIVNMALEGLPTNRDVRANHGAFIRELGAAGTVLLKNENNTLPLRAPKSIGVYGNDAGDLSQGLYPQANFEYGTLSVGGGSGTGRLSYIVSPLEAIKARASQDNTLVEYFLDNSMFADSVGLPGYPAPSTPDVCLVFLKTWETEGSDRPNLTTDWNGTAVVNSVAASCPNTVVITHAGGVNTLPFADNTNVKAILAAHYPGEQTGNSIVDILYGDVNPSGKLPYTVALSESDYNTHITNSTELLFTSNPNAWQSNFTEQLLIDYRYFDAVNKQVQYEFGFGLSYTTFNISNVVGSKVIPTSVAAEPAMVSPQPGGNPTLWDVVFRITAQVSNTGMVAGATVAQLYLEMGSGAPEGTPVRVLRGFEKVSVQPGQSTTVNFDLMRRDLSYWNTLTQQWTIPTGEMTAGVGLSSRDIRGTSKFTVL